MKGEAKDADYGEAATIIGAILLVVLGWSLWIVAYAAFEILEKL